MGGSLSLGKLGGDLRRGLHRHGIEGSGRDRVSREVWEGDKAEMDRVCPRRGLSPKSGLSQLTPLRQHLSAPRPNGVIVLKGSSQAERDAWRALNGCGQIQKGGTKGGGACLGELERVRMGQRAPLTGLHRPHGLCADVHARRALHRLGLLWRASIICFLHAAVALQGLRSWGCGAEQN